MLWRFCSSMSVSPSKFQPCSGLVLSRRRALPPDDLDMPSILLRKVAVDVRFLKTLLQAEWQNRLARSSQPV